MKLKCFTAIAFTAMAIFSCSTDTGTLGSSITNNSDILEVSTGMFKAITRSVLVDSVYARNDGCYFGKVKDPETDAYVKAEFTAQFNMLEGYSMPALSRSLSKDESGNIIADSCEIWLYFDKSASYGDSLTPLKMNILELDRPLSEDMTYYTNFDPKAEGYIRTDGLHKGLMFTMANLTYTDSLRDLSTYSDIVRISLSEPYTDKNGVEYNNYGTYLLRNYYEHPEYFQNSYAFIHTVCPGFYFEFNDGLGVMAKFNTIELRTYSSFQDDDMKYVSVMINSSTPEVLQTTKVTNDKDALKLLADDDSRTYLKSPAGIFTEVTLPIDEITQAHANDSLLTVSVTFQRLNNEEISPYQLSKPTNIMMIPTDSLQVFFEKEKNYDYKSSFMATLSNNSYAFSNIGNLITLMSANKAKGLASDSDWLTKHPNWNKVLLLPISVSTTTTSSTYTSSTTQVIANEMGLSSTQLKGGADTPIEVKVVYGKFKDN